MSSQALYGGDVGSRIEEVTDHGASQVMRREVRHAGFRCPLAHDFAHGLIAYPPPCNIATLIYRAEKRARRITAHFCPFPDRLPAGMSRIRHAALVAFARAHLKRAGARVEVAQVERHYFAAPEPAIVQDGQQGGITLTGGGWVCGTRSKQGA